MHPMRASELRDRTPFPQVRLNEIPANVHRRLPPRCRRCLDTSLADVLNSDTAEGALSRAHVVPCALNAARGHWSSGEQLASGSVASRPGTSGFGCCILIGRIPTAPAHVERTIDLVITRTTRAHPLA